MNAFDDLPPGSQPLDDVPPGSSPLEQALPPGSMPLDAAPSPLEDDEEDERAKDEYIRTLYEAAVAKNPANVASAYQLSESSGAPMELVEGRLDEFKQADEVAKLDPRRWRQDNPGKAALLDKHPELATLAFKEKKLSDFTKAMKWLDRHHFFEHLERSVLAPFAPMLGMIESPEDMMKRFGAPEAEKAPELALYQERNIEGGSLGDIARGALEGYSGGGGVAGAAIGAIGQTRAGRMVSDAWGRRRKASELASLVTKQGLLDAREMVMSGDATAARAAKANRAAVKKLRDELGATPDYGQGALEQLAIDVTESLGSQVDSFQGYGVGGAAGAAVGALATRSVAGARAGLSVGVKLGGVLSTFNQEFGGAYLEFLETKDDQGKPMEREIAMGAAALYGIASAGVELASIGPMLRAFGPIGQAIAAGGGPSAMKAALTDRTMRQALRDAGKTWAQSAAAEGAEEGVQTLLQELAKTGGASLSAGRLQGLDRDALFEDVLDATYKGAVGSGLGLGAAQVSMSLAQESLAIERSRRAGDRAAAIVGLADSEAAAAPEALARLIEIETEQSGEKVTTLYVDPARFTEFVTQQGGDIDQTARELLGEDGPQRVSRALTEAHDSAGNRATLEIPVKEFLERWGRKPIAQALVQDITTRPGHRTPREQLAFQQDVQKLAKQLVSEAKEGQQQEVAAGPNEKAFIKAVESQLVDTGRMSRDEAKKSIATTRALLRTMAARMGEPAEQLFAHWKMTVQNDLGDMIPEASRRLTDQLRAMDPSTPAGLQARGEVMWLDNNTGLLNDRGFKALTPRADRPLVAHYSFEGTKWKNKQGHTPGNELYRIAGQALAGIVDDAAKWGGDFVSSAATPEEAQLNASKMTLAIRDRLRELNPELAERLDGLQVTAVTVPRSDNLDADVKAAGEANAKIKEGRENSGERAKRGERPFGIPVEDPAALMLSSDPAVMRDVPAELLERVAGMSDREVFESAYIDPMTGLLTRQGFFALPKKAHVVSIDLNGLKAINQRWGEGVGDMVIKAFADYAKAMGASAVDMAHLSGDEFALQSDDLDVAQFYVDILAEAAQGITLDLDDGSTLDGVTFGYGIGPDYDAADQLVEGHKLREKERPGTEAEARHNRVVDRGRAGLHEGRSRLARGDLPQGFAGLRRHRRQGSREVRAAADSRRRVERLRVEALQSANPAEVAKALLASASPMGDAAATVTAARLLPKRPGPPFGSKKSAWLTLLGESGIESPSSKEDHAYLLALEKKGPMPGPFAGPQDGTFDAVNEELGLRGSLKVKGAFHAFELLTKGARTWADIEPAVSLLAEVPGLERLRMPEAYTASLAEQRARRAEAEAEDAHYAGRDEDLDTGNDPEFYQPGDEVTDDPRSSARGWVTIAQEGMRTAFRVFLTEKADLSTFLHESAHVYLEMLGDLAEHPAADDRIKSDYATTLKWLGADSRTSLTTEQKEKFARGFEAYLMEGNPPSPGLVEAFTAFRLWLKEIYRTLAALKVELNDDIRGVFDRMLATDQEIERMRSLAGLDVPMWRSHVEAGMTPQEWATYQRERQASLTTTSLRVQRAVAQAQLRATEAFKTAEFKKLREAAAAEWESRPDWRAWRYLKVGEKRVEGGRLVKSAALGKLDRKRVREMLGPDSPLEQELGKRLVDEGGEHPTEVAGDFDYVNGRAMLNAIANMPDRDTWVEERAQELMREKHPEIDGEIARLSDYVQEALHNAGTSEWLLKEWAQLKRQAVRVWNPEANKDVFISSKRLPEGMQRALDVPIEAVKLAAKQLVDERKVGKLDPGATLNRERAAAEAAALAAAVDDFRLAYLHKQSQLLEHYTWRELQFAVNERDGFIKFAERLASKQGQMTLGKAGAIYRDVADQLIEGLGLKTPVTGEREGLGAFLAELDARGLRDAFPADLAARIMGGIDGGWRNLTMTEMREARQALAMVYTAARDRNSVVFAGRRIDVAVLANKITAEAEERLSDKGAKLADPRAKAPRWWSTQRQAPVQSGELTLQGLAASLVEPEELLKSLGETTHRTIWEEGYIKARSHENNLASRVLERLVNLWEQLPTELARTRHDALDDLEGVPIPPDLNLEGAGRTRQWMWMVALNMGNDSNMGRLLGGYGWNERAVRDWLNRNMSKAEWDYVQGIWDLLDRELYPEVAKAYEDVVGLPPKKIEAVSITTPHGVYRGGYFPARYDPDVTRVGRDQSSEAERKLFGARAGQVSVMKGFTKERASTYSDVINLQWSSVPSHVSQVIHYVAYDRFVRDAAQVLNFGGVEGVDESGAPMTMASVPATVQRRLGFKYEPQVTAWLQTVANAQADAIPQQLKPVMDALQWGRSRLTLPTLGLSLGIAIADFANPLVAIAKGDIKLLNRYLVPSLLDSIGHFPTTRKTALEKSPELRDRSQNARRMLMDHLADVSKGTERGLIDAVRDTAWLFMEWTDRITSTVIWQAAYRQGRGAGLEEGEAITRADAAVRGSLPSMNPAQQPALLRDKRGAGSVLVFYGYFSKLYNVNRSIWLDPLNQWERAEGFSEKLAVVPSAAGAAARTMGVIFAANILGELLSGRGPDEGEPEAEWLLRKTLAAPFLTLPIVGQIAEQLINAGVSAAVHGEVKMRPISMRASPSLAAVERVSRAAWKMLDEDRAGDQRVWDFLEAAGVIAKLPTAQVVRTGRYITSGQAAADLAGGELADFAGGVIYGERPPQQAR